MLKSLVTVLALSASVLAVPKREPDGLPKCGAPAAQSCNRLPPKSTKSCLSSIEKANIAIKTCANPTSVQIVTVTETAKPRFWQTTTQEITSTSTFTSHTNITVFSTAVQTSVATVTETATASAFNTLTSTFHTNVTSTQVSTLKSTITSTLVKDQTKETCAARRAVDLEDLEKRNRDRDRLPDDCSCFLTSTAYSGVQTYSTTVTTTPTVTKVKTVPATATITTTWTITKPVTSTYVSTQEQSTTLTTTEKVTQVITTTWSLTTTQVTTLVQTKTATSVLDVCATASPLPSAISGDRATNGQNVPRIRNYADCCRACFKTPGCVFYDFSPNGNDCTVFTPKTGSDCKTDSCLSGKADVQLAQLKRSNKDLYGYGPCIGGVWPA